MEITENEEVKEQKHSRYIDYEREQYILDFDKPTDKVTIIAYDDGVEIFRRDFIAKFINTHLNINWQDKGPKNIGTEEWIWKLVLKEIEK